MYRKYLLPLQSGRLELSGILNKKDGCYEEAAACLREAEDANRTKLPGYELLIKGALFRFLAILMAQGKQLPLSETADTMRLKQVLQWISVHYGTKLPRGRCCQHLPVQFPVILCVGLKK